MNKEVKKGLVPELRFPEFQNAEDWQTGMLGDKNFATFVKERTPLEKLNLESYVSTENLLPDYAGVTIASKLPPAGSCTRFKTGDVLISNIRPYLKKVWIANKDGASSNDVIVIRSQQKVSDSFLALLLKNDEFINYIMKGAKGVKMPRGDISLMREYIVAFPTKESGEQTKIAACLSSLDDLITAQTQKIEALKTHKKGLMQQLFPQEGETVPKLRFPEFSGKWKKRKLNEFITERNEPSTEKSPLYSLTIENGITPKTERYERSFLVKDEEDAYKLVFPNDFAYNPMNLRFGAIAKHSGSEKVLLSKYYNIFYCNNTVDAKFCELYFKSYGMIAHYNNVATGSLIEKRRVHFSSFLKFNIRFPILSEQQKIADCLSSLDDLINAHVKKCELLKIHKKGLMQGLFPSSNGKDYTKSRQNLDTSETIEEISRKAMELRT